MFHIVSMPSTTCCISHKSKVKILSLHCFSDCEHRDCTLTAEDMEKYREVISRSAPLLLRECIKKDCSHCSQEPASPDSSKLIGDYLDCEERKNIALIRVIGQGMKYQMHRLLSILNDLNGRLLFYEYKRDPLFHCFDAGRGTELKTEDVDEDDEDAIIDYEQPARRLLCLQDSLPLINTVGRKLFNDRHWKLLRKLPLQSALRTYHERLAPPLDFCPRYLIKDDISRYLETISIVTYNIKDLVNDNGMPMQFDLVIFSKKVVRNPAYEEDVETDHSRIESQSNNDETVWQSAEPMMPYDENLSARKLEHLEDTIGDVSARLMSLPMSYHDHLYKNEDDDTQTFFELHPTIGVNGSARALRNEMKKIPFFNAGTRHGRYVCVIERPSMQSRDNDQVGDDEVDDGQMNKVQTADSHESNISDPTDPLKQRANGLPRAEKQLSPRAKAMELKADGRRDLLYFFQPPKPHGDINHGVAMAEAMHSDTLEYLLPAIKGEKCPIGARHLCGGKMFCLSFHIMSMEQINCYLYIDQKCIRIHLNESHPMMELMHILPHYFDDDEFVLLSIKNALQGAGFGDEVFHQVDLWMQQWHEREREIQLLNDLSQVQLSQLPVGSRDPIVIEVPTPLGRHVIEQCDWDVLDDKIRNGKLLLFYKVLRELFGVPYKDDRWEKMLNKSKSHDYSTSFFSTMDEEYDAMRAKLLKEAFDGRKNTRWPMKPH